MARASVTTQKITRAGVTPTLAAPTADGDIVDCGNVVLWVDNADAESINVTVTSTATQDGLDVADLVVAVAAGAFKLIGPLPAHTFGQDPDSDDAGRAYVDYSGQTSVTRGVISF